MSLVYKDADPKHCKASVPDIVGWHSHQCSRRPWSDGWCKQHHPTTKDKRREKAAKDYHDKMTRRTHFRNKAGVNAFTRWLHQIGETGLAKRIEDLLPKWTGKKDE